MRKRATKRPRPSLIKSALREIWLWSDERREALKHARRPGGYLCAHCRAVFPKAEVQVDHIQPVGAAPGGRNARGGETWDGIIARLFVPAIRLQVLCESCHDLKSHTDRHGAKGLRPLF